MTTELKRNVTLGVNGNSWYPGTHTQLGYAHQRIRDESGKEFRRGTVVVRDPNVAKVRQVQREFELRASLPTPTLDQIRRQIIAEGFIPIAAIRKYHAGSIERRLKSIFYDCRFDWQGVEYQGKHERIIPKETFWRVQETFGIRNPYGKNLDALFGNGWMKCADPECGCSVVYDPICKTIKATGERKTFRYYHCTNGKRVHPSLKGMRVAEDDLMNQFGEAVGRISIHEDFRDQLLAALNKTQVKARAAIKQDIDNYKTALASVREKENRAYDHYDAGVVDRETYNRQRMRLQQEQVHYTGLMEKAQLAINDVAGETVKSILQLATNAESLWKRRSPRERRQLLEKILSNPVLDGATVRYEIIKRLRLLSEMKEDPKWRREVADFRTECLNYAV